MTNDDGNHEYSLVMPFIACQSQGGPYQDEAFVAGFHLGQLDIALTRGITEELSSVEATALIPQLDLLAMRHGLTLEHRTWDEDPKWSFVTFCPPGRTPEQGEQ